MNLNKQRYSPPPLLNPLELLVVQVKSLLSEYLQTMVQISFILQQLQMLQMQIAPDPKAKKEKSPKTKKPKVQQLKNRPGQCFLKLNKIPIQRLCKKVKSQSQPSRRRPCQQINWTLCSCQLNLLWSPVSRINISGQNITRSNGQWISHFGPTRCYLMRKCIKSKQFGPSVYS